MAIALLYAFLSRRKKLYIKWQTMLPKNVQETKGTQEKTRELAICPFNLISYANNQWNCCTNGQSFRQAIVTENRVAITLWCLATPCEYRTVSHLFGVARSTVCTIVHDTCNAIVNCLLKECMLFLHAVFYTIYVKFMENLSMIHGYRMNLIFSNPHHHHLVLLL